MNLGFVVMYISVLFQRQLQVICERRPLFITFVLNRSKTTFVRYNLHQIIDGNARKGSQYTNKDKYKGIVGRNAL